MTPDTNPSGYWASVGTIVAATLALGVSFGLPLTEEQQSAILAWTTAVTPVVMGLLISRWAWAPQTVRNRLSEQAMSTALERPSVRPPDSRQ